MITYTFDVVPLSGTSSNFSLITEEGIAFGSYQIGRGALRAFGFTIDSGFFDISELVGADELAANGIAFISRVVRYSANGYIFGEAKTIDGYYRNFTLGLTPRKSTSVPAPTTLILFIMGFLVFVRSRHS
ncbi:PEP-CTERM sorting domain-containing protein [Thalassotalea mangrovi]|uniref:PEP-CTERM sorting domain-containing protein n=1 Tax=Thalassotalea mangrovi TaxID=2572245 RepID=A0A4U1B8Z4_9GAMM|nr:PEP-CTERM sorting domain-containing protein [Thalassotalea mangrovi]TKB47166.1 PEP-CTERM sorting domain-containing protein [Thalassotalea mangrovi]